LKNKQPTDRHEVSLGFLMASTIPLGGKRPQTGAFLPAAIDSDNQHPSQEKPMYFILGLLIVIATIAFLEYACILLLALARLVAKTLKRFIPSRRTKRVRRRKAMPIKAMPTGNQDWEAISRETRRSLLKSGPRASRETVLLSDLDLEIAIELKEQELQRIKADFERMGQRDDSWNRPVRPAVMRQSAGTRVVQTSRFMH
jgi:hypothetical protein